MVSPKLPLEQYRHSKSLLLLLLFSSFFNFYCFDDENGHLLSSLNAMSLEFGFMQDKEWDHKHFCSLFRCCALFFGHISSHI